MDLSIIIVSWKVKDLLEKCLVSVYQQTKDIDFEVILIDNDSQDGTEEMVGENFLSVNFIQAGKNLGFAKANNLGIKKAKGDYILLLNPDTVILDGALQKCINFMRRKKNVDVLGAKLVYPDGCLQESCRRFPNVFSQIMILLKIHNFILPKSLQRYYLKDFSYDYTKEVDQVMGAFLLVRSEMFKNIGVLDEKFWAWFEEVDWCKRAKDAGYRIVFYPDAQIVHYKGGSFSKYFKRQILFNRSLLTYFKKHHSWIEVFLLVMIIPFNLILDRLAALALFLKIPLKKKKNL